MWIALDNSSIDPCRWGWHLVAGKLDPIASDQQHAPDDVLNMVRCKCTKGCLSSNCSCRRSNHTCMAACVNCHGMTCNNCDVTAKKPLEISQEDEGPAQNFNLPDVLFDDELDWLEEETVDEVKIVKVDKGLSPNVLIPILVKFIRFDSRSGR